MTKLLPFLFITILCSSCAVATLATTTIKTTAKIVTLPIMAIGAAVEAITPDDEEEAVEGEGADIEG
ncbi:MAG TPA: hypothetical protein EYF97_01840 [Gammaproteobacteria bacterium]|jgi:hypothetical protein|nr:hypothetical protein [Gammaproteobacteria bacterium]